MPTFKTTLLLLTILSLLPMTLPATPNKQLIQGKLAPCPHSPNCISTETNTIKPVSIAEFTPQEAWSILRASLVQLGGKIEKEQSTYMWASFQTTVLKFTDDVEARLDAHSQMIHLRSASRIGFYDFNTNRQRLEKLINLLKANLVRH